jgi:pilus assembly protein CpaB
MDRRGRVRTWRDLSTQVGLRRRLIVALLTGIAVVSALSAIRPSPAPGRQVWVAAHNLSGGEPLTAGDVRVERLPRTDLPADVLAAGVSIVGRLLAAPMRRDEPFTDVRLLSPSLLSATDQPGAVAVPVRVADGPATLALVHPGDLIDVIAAPDADSGAAPTSFTVVRDVRVLATPVPDEDAQSGDTAGLLIVAASNRQAATLAQAVVGARLSVAVHRQS